MAAAHAIGVAAVITAAVIVGSLHWRARDHVVRLGFWFDDVTFEVPGADRIGGPLAAAERERIESIARTEIEAAFAMFQVRLSDNRDAFYRVRVRQLLTLYRRVPLSGQSNAFGPLGGAGAVSFATLASQAISHAPPGTGRDAIVDGIGRGIGRAAVHEFVHQMLPHAPIHASQDVESYEYQSSSRRSQFYGPMRWDVAREPLVKRLGTWDGVRTN